MPRFLRRLIRHLAATEIRLERADAYHMGVRDGYNRGHDDARGDIEGELGRSYCVGITDGVYLALSEPGHIPQMTNKPDEALVTTRMFYDAIDRADRLRRIPRKS